MWSCATQPQGFMIRESMLANTDTRVSRPKFVHRESLPTSSSSCISKPPKGLQTKEDVSRRQRNKHASDRPTKRASAVPSEQYTGAALVACLLAALAKTTRGKKKNLGKPLSGPPNKTTKMAKKRDGDASERQHGRSKKQEESGTGGAVAELRPL